MCGAYDRVNILNAVTGEILASFNDEELAYNILYWFFLKTIFVFKFENQNQNSDLKIENWKWGLKNENWKNKR